MQKNEEQFFFSLPCLLPLSESVRESSPVHFAHAEASAIRQGNTALTFFAVIACPVVEGQTKEKRNVAHGVLLIQWLQIADKQNNSCRCSARNNFKPGGGPFLVYPNTLSKDIFARLMPRSCS